MVHGVHRVRKLLGVGQDFVRIFCPNFSNRVQPCQPLFTPEIGPTPNRAPVWQRYAIQRPPASPRHELHGIHIHLVHIRPLLAIHLDIQEMGIHEGGSLLIFERLVLHDVAPVTGTVPDADHNELVLFPSLFPNGIAPRMPIHRIVLMLLEIRRGGPCKPIHMHGSEEIRPWACQTRGCCCQPCPGTPGASPPCVRCSCCS